MRVKLQTRPWTVSVEGEVGKPRTFRYRRTAQARAHGRAGLPVALCRRLVHGHSLGGYSALLKQVEPTANAKYVELVTVMQRDNMPGVRAGCWTGHMWKACASTKPCTRWPCWCSACTARSCPIRTGAFAAGGAVEVRLQIGQIAGQDPAGRKQPVSSWIKAAPQEYGFYANVNPACRIRAGVRPASGASARRPVQSEAQDAAVQWLCGSGRGPLSGHGSEGQLLRRAWPTGAPAPHTSTAAETRRDAATPKAQWSALGRARQARAVSVGNDAFRPLDLAGLNNGLTANPVEFLTRSSGTWTLVCLLVTLAITPLRRLTGSRRWWLRRMRAVCLFTASSISWPGSGGPGI